MRLLLDTHILLWLAADSRKLKRAARDLIEAADAVYVSSVSIWEIAMKARLGRIDADAGAIAAGLQGAGLHELPVRAVHAARVQSLALHHKDPFDHLLIAQALVEPLRLLTTDDALVAYSDLVTLV